MNEIKGQDSKRKKKGQKKEGHVPAGPGSGQVISHPFHWNRKLIKWGNSKQGKSWSKRKNLNLA